MKRGMCMGPRVAEKRGYVTPPVDPARRRWHAAAMKPTLVTGANGHLGNNLCRQLVARAEPVRAMIRPNADPASLAGLEVELVRGDITDATSVAAAERGAFAIAARTGLAVTSVHPGLILGPRFWKPSESVAQVVQFLNQGAPVYFDGGFSVVDVEDVASGAILAMEKGRRGEKYILAGGNVTVKQLFDLMAEQTGLKAPTLKLPVPVIRGVATLLELVSSVTGTRPMIDPSHGAES